ncbi:MAG: hypothetical protein E6Q93_01280 [Burkholderiaceae bacterium]|nr:MAG: hypothetical protein E6Q93_01280 [Burkholderiaceae bacterium]
MAQTHQPGSATTGTLDREDTTAPAQSATFVQTLTQAQEAGVDRDALSRLFWLMNAHPRLLGHQRCLQNLLALLSTPELTDGIQDWADSWTEDIPAWTTAAMWAAKVIGNAPGSLEPFIRQPRNEHHHLLMRHGINRHPVAGALWIRHHSDPDPSLPSAGLAPPGRMFRLLQWHFFCSQAEARYQHSTLEQYLQYDRMGEWPAWPRPAAAVGLALRQLSYSAWDPLLAELPFETRLDDFNEALTDARDRLLIRHADGEARSRIVALTGYFEDFRLYFQGLPAQRRRRSGGGSGGSRKGIPGFIHFTASPNVFFELPEPETGDEDVPTRNVTRAYIHSDGLTPQKVSELEGLGIAPSEDLRPIMDLFPIEDRPGGVHGLWTMRQATEAAAQRDYWDKTQLTPLETAVLLDTLDASQRGPTERGLNVLDEAARLILKCMLVFGCQQEDARTIRTMLLAELEAVIAGGGCLAARVVLVDGDTGNSAGFAVPAIGPRYTSEPPTSFSQRANASERYVTLPDISGLGAALLLHQRSGGGEIGGPVFHESPERIAAKLKELLQTANQALDPQSRARLTTTKVSRKLPSLLSRAGADEVGVAIVSGDLRYEGQARTHYTQHRTDYLAKAYTKAVRRLFTEARRPIATAWRTNLPTHNGVVGARLVVRHEDLRDFIVALNAELRREPSMTRSARHRYHQAFLLYTIVMQGLLTGIRPSNRPDRLLGEVLPQVEPMVGSLCVASVVEKDDQYEARARPVAIPSRLQRQFANVAAHARATWRWQPVDLSIPAITTAQQMLMDWADDRPKPRAQLVDGQWLARQLSQFGFPAAANFTRAYLRTWLLADGCPEQVIDAFLGHAGAGQSLTHMHGTFDFRQHLREIEVRLERMANELSLEPVASRLADPGVDASTAPALGA